LPLIPRNTRLVDADGARTADLANHDGRITAIGPSLQLIGDQELDLAGSTVTPGLFDRSDAQEDALFEDGVMRPVWALPGGE
jgi:dihydroorotase-like cyclic amidohydrolase